MLFSSQMELVLERIFDANENFQGGERLILLQRVLLT
jgi:hypothetical protein